MGLSLGFTKRERELGTTCDFKRRQRAKCLPLTLKPLTWGAELRRAEAKALRWLWTHHPTSGVSPSYPLQTRAWRRVRAELFSEAQTQQAHLLLPAYSRGFPGALRRLKAS